MDGQTSLGNFGAPFQIDWRGQKLNLSYRTQKVKACIERWAKTTKIKELVALKGILPEEDYVKELRTLLDAFSSDEYAYGSDILEKMRQSPAGKIAHARILLGEKGESMSDSEFLELLYEKGEEIFIFAQACAAKVETIQKELGWDPEKEGGGIDPKELPRRLKAAGLWD